MQVGWPAFTSGSSTNTAQGYELDASSSSNFVTYTSSVTTAVTRSTLTVSGLLPYTTYYLRAGAMNWDGVVNFVSLSTSTALGCGTIHSVASSSWSLPSTWDIGAVPTSCNGVVITAGNTVAIDISSATASTTTIAGTLTYGRSGDNELMMVQGSMTVVAGGILDMGNSTSPIPSGTTAYLTLAYGTPAGQYGLLISTGGNYSVYGAAKNLGTVATSGDITPATNNITVADATGWQMGDAIAIDTETVSITSVPSGNSFGITSPSFTHFSTNTIRVTVLSHNVVVRSSSTDTSDASTTSSYIQTLTKNTTSFSLTYGEFAYLGTNIIGQQGIDFENATGIVSSCTVRNGHSGVYLRNSSNITVSNNTLEGNIFPGIFLVASANNTLLANSVYNNGHQGINLSAASTNNTLTSNVLYDNGGYGIYVLAASNNNTLISNIAYADGIGIALSNPVSNSTLISNVVHGETTGLFLWAATNSTLRPT